MDDAVAFAEASPLPDLATAPANVTSLPTESWESPMSEPMTYGQAFQRAMREEMERDETIFVLGTDLFVRGGHFAQVKGLGEFGQARVRDTPISEAAMVAAGVGAALNGMRPVVDLNFIDFAFGAMDEIVNQAAKMRYMCGSRCRSSSAPPRASRSTPPSTTTASRPGSRHTPGLVVAMPSTPADTKGLLKSALRGEDPVVFLMHKRLRRPRRGRRPGRARPVREGRGRAARAPT